MTRAFELTFVLSRSLQPNRRPLLYVREGGVG
jgi:hypothetical protein